jgi:hypothetical protein
MNRKVLLLTIFCLLPVTMLDAQVLGRRKPTAEMSVDNSIIAAGGSATVSWLTGNATSATFGTEKSFYTFNDPVNVPLAGSIVVNPTETTTYYLLARNRRYDLNHNGRSDGRRNSTWASATVAVETLEPGWPWSVKADFWAEPKTIIKGGKSTLYWESSRATKRAELDGVEVALSGSKEVTPDKTSNYTLTVYGRKLSLAKMVSVTVTDPAPVPPDPNPPVPPDPNPPGPNPPVPPVPVPGDSNLSVVAFGDAFALSDSLSTKARSKEVAEYLTACGGTWIEVSEALLKDIHPAALDKWWAAYKASGKTLPCVATFQRIAGKVVNVQWDEVNDQTDIMLLLKSRTPQAKDNSIVIHGKKRSLGFKKTPAKKRGIVNGQQAATVKEILTPKTVNDIPAGGIDLRHLMPFLLDQDGYGTCVSQAVASAAASASYVQYGPKNFTLFSPNELATRIDGWDGAWAEQVMDEIVTNGVVELSDQPNYQQSLPSNWKAKANQHRAIGVYRSPQKDARGYIIAALLRGYPVVVAISVGNGFDPDENGCISYRGGSGGSVNHEVVFCGVKVVNGQLRWLMKNSWGQWGIYGDGTAWLVEDSGNAGYGWIADDLDLDFWVIVRMSAADDYQIDEPPAVEDKPVPIPIKTTYLDYSQLFQAA